MENLLTVTTTLQVESLGHGGVLKDDTAVQRLDLSTHSRKVVGLDADREHERKWQEMAGSGRKWWIFRIRQ